LARIVREIAPDLVIVMGHVGSLTYWRLGALSKRLGFKYVTWQCGYEYNPSRIKDFFTKGFLKQFHYHLAYHSGAKKYLMAHGVPEPKIATIHNTINEEEIDLLPRDEARRRVATELGLPLHRPIVLYVGAILHEKRMNVLIDAVRLLGPNAVSLVIVGDGPALAQLKSLSADLDCVRFPGRIIKGVGCFFDAADVFVLPGTGGLAINEAMVHGLPIITGRADGSAEDLVADGLNGYILKEGDAAEIATRLKQVLSDPEARMRMASVSRELITTKYSFKSFIDRVVEGLRKALGEGAPDLPDREKRSHSEAVSMLSHR
jgi:glycosyltransferase involved in cell wall biosynthesis